MRAIDTNLIVRLLVNDDEQQVVRARRLIDSEPVLVTMTVVLETEWVLRSAYSFPKNDIIAGLRVVFAHANMRLVEPLVVERALALAEEGLPINDAMHIASSWAADASAFVTFDEPLINAAKQIGSIVVEAPAKL